MKTYEEIKKQYKNLDEMIEDLERLYAQDFTTENLEDSLDLSLTLETIRYFLDTSANDYLNFNQGKLERNKLVSDYQKFLYENKSDLDFDKELLINYTKFYLYKRIIDNNSVSQDMFYRNLKDLKYKNLYA